MTYNTRSSCKQKVSTWVFSVKLNSYSSLEERTCHTRGVLSASTTQTVAHQVQGLLLAATIFLTTGFLILFLVRLLASRPGPICSRYDSQFLTPFTLYIVLQHHLSMPSGLSRSAVFKSITFNTASLLNPPKPLLPWVHGMTHHWQSCWAATTSVESQRDRKGKSKASDDIIIVGDS
jgi:hypothetical protein